MTNTHANGLPDVGLYVDDERSIAAVSRPTRGTSSLHVASLHRTVLYVHGDGSASVGGTADPNAAQFTGFVADEVESGFEAGDLVAMTFRCLLAEVAASVGTDPSSLATAATFPNTWTAERVSAVRMAMNRIGLDHVALVPEAEALSAWSQSTQATWAGSDSGIAAARGAAGLAGEFPVDLVTEVITKPRTVLPIWARTPVLAAAGVAAVLVLGAGATALMLQNPSSPSVPEIENAQIAAPTTTASRPAANAPFPTVVPIAETAPEFSPVPAPVDVVPSVALSTTEPSGTTQSASIRPATAEPETASPDSTPETTDPETTDPETTDPELSDPDEPVTQNPGDNESGGNESGGNESGENEGAPGGDA